MKKTIFILSSLFFLSLMGNAQEEDEINEAGISHKVAVVFGYTYIPVAFEEGKEEGSVFVPTLGLDYFMQFKERWKIGAVLDLELANYIVDLNREELERDKALVTGILVGYEFAPRWSFLIGPGMEFEKHENLFIIRMSTEYEFELGNNWGLFPSANYDLKKEYSTWSLNMGVSKRL